ncbi:hemerythrin domain-containing protein, partial [Chloroflexota bacterium]
INRVIEWHHTIRKQVKLAEDSITDQEAMLTMEGTKSDWIPSKPKILSEQQQKLQQTMSFLGDGLENHFAYEEKVLPPLLGQLFMRALILDHQEIRKEINEAKQIVTDIKFEGLSRDELILAEMRIQQAIGSIGNFVEEHATKEEIILEMVQRALKDEGGKLNG